jgi:F-type H+-transporting ATPase subunit b
MKQTHLTFSAVLLASTSASASSLPQMDPTWYPNQLLWLAISFGVLYAAVGLFIAPTIKSILGTREDAISEAIAEAERAKHEAESTRGNSESARHDARIRAAEAMAKAQAENNANAAEAIAKLDNDLARRADHAAAILEDTVAKAKAGVEASAQSLAMAMAEKLLSDAAPSDATAPKLKLATSR